jgi:hypothetical protein
MFMSVSNVEMSLKFFLKLRLKKQSARAASHLEVKESLIFRRVFGMIRMNQAKGPEVNLIGRVPMSFFPVSHDAFLSASYRHPFLRSEKHCKRLVKKGSGQACKFSL